MKKVLKFFKFFTLAIFVLSSIVSCDKSSKNQNSNISTESAISGNYGILNLYPKAVRARVVIRHSGSGDCVCPKCKCPGCKCPLGICTCASFSLIEPATLLTADELSQDMGTVYMVKISDAQIKMIFEQPTALANGTVPVNGGNPVLPSEISQALGFSGNVIIEEGMYEADFSNFEFGEITINVLE